MKNIFIGIGIALLVVFTFRYCESKRNERAQLSEATALIQEQVKNVGKLVVTEGSFSQVLTYEDSKKFYLDFFSAKKRALIVVNAKVMVAYDLRKLETEIQEDTKTIVIKKIPEEELTISPDIEYYDVSQDYLNQFDASDYNEIKQRVKKSIKYKVDESNLRNNAQNRLVSELSNIFILTKSLGWKIVYNNKQIKQNDDFQSVID